MLQVRGISKTFQSGRGRISAVNDVSFTAGSGSVTALMGKSGSGKTTLLYCICGLLIPEKGDVICDDISLNRLTPAALSRFQRNCMGIIFQQANLLSYYTVFDNIALPLILNGMSPKACRRRITFLLERIGLTGAEKALPNELSGGEAQRVAAARAMAHHPKLLIADEPTASLDSDTGRQLIQLLLEMSKEQRCILIFSTHDPELLQPADRSLRLKDGTLI